ncbi:HNH endonuclease [Vibrio phage 1.097.O._10N.286.49.B3]|uniref:AP2/ERF domain-containing protein n=1 Tax=Vibrio phage 1.097.O._10N.286.49.B3 TaxID=1881383 RepID=A0A2I7R0K2_9CAUD|nr:HNH endonuclease [Vibrio phage 1.097.O._10N.286.49.B3]AUR87180.1 hypothetical protein NVP1097O_34 [Vibrio phage 1.097.O._10N.286.49.B3]
MARIRSGKELDPLYGRWLAMRQRCNNPNYVSYKNYGARGISICPTLQAFDDYKAYVESLPDCDPVNLTLDRIDSNKNYEQGNLRWTNLNIQNANRTHSGHGNNKYMGIGWNKAKQRWRARINLNGKSLFDKTYLTEQEALDARNTYIRTNNLPHPIQ